MTKSSAFGTVLQMGIRQVETAVIVGTIVNPGNASVTLTVAGMTGSGSAQNVAVLAGDTADTVATKIVAALNAIANYTAKCAFSCSGSSVRVELLTAAANDGTMNLAYTNGTCTGLTPDATSNHTTAGAALTAVAQVKSLEGPELAADTEDVTTHDSTSGFEENIVTILRSGEINAELEYDPGAATHAATSGLIAKLQNKTQAQYQIVFPGSVTWTFDGRSTKFKPGAPVDGSLTASATIKINSVPTLV
jgi:hypothetical protein